MRIGIMLRAYDEKGGVGVYTKNILEELLKIDQENRYFLFYRSKENIGSYADKLNVEEHVVCGSNKFIWDQIKIPQACKNFKIDVLFHPKFTAPLFAPCPVVMTVHGADWFMPDQSIYYPAYDVAYMRMIMPLYIKKCSKVISVSELTTINFNHVLDLDKNKIKTIYFAPANHFGRVQDQKKLEQVRRKYNLPQKFLLTLTKISGDKRKNLGRLLSGYKKYWEGVESPLKLVIGGKDCHLLKKKYDLENHPVSDSLVFPGWLDQKDLPAIYTLATAYLYPSNLEAFPIPITEALKCGTPVLTSNVNGLEEIAGNAALFVSPDDPNDIARGIEDIGHNTEIQRELMQLGIERSKAFNWQKCAEETLSILTSSV